MEWFDKLGQFPILQLAAAVPIIAVGLMALRKGLQVQSRDGGEANVPVSTIYLREMCETLKRIEATVAAMTRRDRRRQR